MSAPQSRNCVDIVRPFAEAMQETGRPDYQVLGGIGSAALQHDATVIDLDGQRIIGPSGLYLPQYREEGTLRDFDLLVLSASQADVDEVQAVADETIGDALEQREPFSFRPITMLDHQARRPFGWSATKTFLADRYAEMGADGTVRRTKKALFPFAANIDTEALATWSTEAGGVTLPTAHPGATVLNYLTRSISGLRWKDADKVEKLAQTIFQREPRVLEWIVDGPGKSQLEFARVLHTLRQPAEDPQKLVIGGELEIVPYALTELRDHPSFMLSHGIETTQSAVLALARVKSRVLGVAESNPTIVKLFQQHAEGRLSTVTNNH